MKRISLVTSFLIIVICYFTIPATSAYAGGGHAHFGRSEFVNGGMSPDQMAQSIMDIRVKVDYAKELIQAGDLTEVEEVAHSISDLSNWVADNASMNRARHANLKRASKSISRAANKLKKHAAKGDALKAEEQVNRIHKLLEFAV